MASGHDQYAGGIPQHITVDDEMVRTVCLAGHRTSWPEIIISLLFLPSCVLIGLKTSQPWTFYIATPIILWRAGFLVAHESRRRRKRSLLHDSPIDCAEYAVAEAEDEIRLVNSSYWWYTLPLGLSLAVFLAHSAWLDSGSGVQPFAFIILVLAAWSFFYWIGQFTVRPRLDSRHAMLLVILRKVKECRSPQV